MHTNSYDSRNGRIYQIFNLRRMTGRGGSDGSGGKRGPARKVATASDAS